MTAATYDILDSQSKYSIIIISRNKEIAIDNQSNVISDLQETRFRGMVLLDNLAAHGKRNRFSEVYFDGNKFDYHTLSFVKDISDDIKTELDDYYQDNPLPNDIENLNTPKSKFIILNPSRGYLNENMEYPSFKIDDAALFTANDIKARNLNTNEFVQIPVSEYQLDNMTYQLSDVNLANVKDSTSQSLIMNDLIAKELNL